MAGDKKPVDPESNRSSGEKAERSERSNLGTVRKDAFLTVVVDMATSVGRAGVTQAAAAISYYSLFSLFPLVLFLVVIFSYFVDVAAVKELILDLLGTIGSGVDTIIVENIQGIFEKRATTSITAALTLLWSGSGAFSSIIQNVHNAWPESKGRGFLVNRALAITGILFTVLILGTLLIFSIINDLFDWVRMVPILRYAVVRWVFAFLTGYLLPFLLMYLVLYMLYRYIPAVEVDRSAARISSFIAIGMLTLFTKFFSAFLISPFNKYDAVYGSVTVIIILLLYIYVMAYIVLCGAHLCAAITHYRRKRGAAKSGLLRSSSPLSGRNGVKSRSAVKKETRAQRAAASLRGWVRDRRFGGREFEKRWIDRLVRLRQSDAWQKFVTVVKNICSSLFRWK